MGTTMWIFLLLVAFVTSYLTQDETVKALNDIRPVWGSSDFKFGHATFNDPDTLDSTSKMMSYESLRKHLDAMLKVIESRSPTKLFYYLAVGSAVDPFVAKAKSTHAVPHLEYDMHDVQVFSGANGGPPSITGVINFKVVQADGKTDNYLVKVLLQKDVVSPTKWRIMNAFKCPTVKCENVVFF